MAVQDNNYDNDHKLPQLQSYQQTPEYILHGPGDDRLAILVCQIKVWKPQGTDWFTIPDNTQCLVIKECESIEISHSYKDLISKAVIKFPRGTIVEKRGQGNVSVNNGDGTAQSLSVAEATANGDLTEYSMQSVPDGSKVDQKVKAEHNIVSMDGSQVNMGLTGLNQHLNETALLDPNDFTTGNRIEIRLGYAYSEQEYNYLQNYKGKIPPNMEVAFTGFITGCSVATPLEIECENMAHVLTTINVPDITAKGTMTLKDFLADDGKYHLLKDTGISLSEGVLSNMDKIEVAKFHISSQLTVADVLAEWQKCGLTSFMETDLSGKSTLKIGRVYYSGLNGGAMPTSDARYITYNKNSQYNIIQFDWDVAEDGLNLINTDKKYLAVKAMGREKDGKWINFTLRKTPDAVGDWVASEGDFEGTFLVNNEKKTRPKRGRKHKDGTRSPSPGGTTYEKGTLNKADLSHYNVINYISPTHPITRDKLLEEAKQYWGKYVPNGISGKLVIFGDLQVRPSDIVGLIDPRQPQKNGYYLVEAVNTSFGVNGFRKELKIPYKIASFKDYPVYKIQ